MTVKPIGRLHFLVSSRTRWERETFIGDQPRELRGRVRLHHIVDLEPQPYSGPYFCSCEAFNLSHEWHGEPCAHILAALAYAEAQRATATEAARRSAL